MTQQEFNFIDRQLKHISLRNIIALILCTATSVGTVLGVYYGFKTEQAIMKLQIKILEQRVEKLEGVI
jgi:hypothetical protein